MREEEHYYILTADYIIYQHEYKVLQYTCGLYVCNTPIQEIQPINRVKIEVSAPPPNYNIL